MYQLCLMQISIYPDIVKRFLLTPEILMSTSDRRSAPDARERAMDIMLRHAEAREQSGGKARPRSKKSGSASPASGTDPRPAPLVTPRPQEHKQLPPQQQPKRRPWSRARELTPEEREQRRKLGPLAAERVMDGVLRGLGSSPEQARLSLLWRHWEIVMGEELAPLARPLGHRDDTLLVGADDAMSLQELHLQADEMLERVNAFMEKPFFRTVKVSLILGKAELDGPLRCAAAFEEYTPPLPRSAADGRYLSDMNPDSPVARAYARFAARRR